MADPDPIKRLNASLEGRYRVERELGQGGMATVYLAEDLKHERKVALKVLKPELAAVVGADRFLAEIKTTANLQHPHILGLHDSGEADGLLFYVMPFVEGESLRDRLDREHQLPVDDAVGIATNLAEALDYAHRQGVIHRDIKPANVLLQDGKPVISDFGIALAVGAAGGGRLTETGLSLGTPHYMSPEQATGDLNVGPPTDVYALACVLYEMLVGEPPFTGSTPQAVLGKIITADIPSANAERSSVPTNVDAALAKALEKVPADRFAGAGDFVKALVDPGFRYGVGSHSARSTSGSRIPALTTAALAGIVVGVAVMAALRPPDALPIAGSITLPEDAALSTVVVRMLDVSPDGMTVAYNGTGAAGERQVYLRQLDGFETRAVPGSVGAGSILFSPDGQSILYSMGPEIRRGPVGGGPSLTVCTVDCLGMTFGTGTGADTIIYTNFGDGLLQRSASSGDPTPLTTLDADAGEVDHVWPEALPNGAILYGVQSSTGAEEVRLLSDDGSRTVVSGTSQARYTNGWLLYALGSSLFAVEFDPSQGRTAGEAVVLLDDLWVDGRAAFAVGDDGTLVYVPASASADERVLVRVSRDGEPTVVHSGELEFERPRLSPVDSTLLLFTHRGDLWTFDIASQVERRLTNGGESDGPIWASGDRVLYRSSQGGVPNIYMKSADERDDGRRFLESEQQQWPADVTSDGGTLVFSQRGPSTDGDIWMVPFEEGAEPTLLLGDEFTTWPGGVSPDGRWLVYVTNRDGRFEVYVTDFPDLVSHRRVSMGEGIEPAWSPAGGELFYRDGTRMMVVAYRMDEDGDFDPEPARELFDGSFLQCCPGLAQYAVAADGQSFFMLQGAEPREIRFLRGWERRAAAAR